MPNDYYVDERELVKGYLCGGGEGDSGKNVWLIFKNCKIFATGFCDILILFIQIFCGSAAYDTSQTYKNTRIKAGEMIL